MNKGSFNTPAGRSKVLEILSTVGISYTRKGKNIVCRCPICKRDSKLDSHNAEINPDTNTLYCFSEAKLYTLKELVTALKEIGYTVDIDFSYIQNKRKQQAKDNAELSKKEIKEFEQVKNALLEKGYRVTGIYDFFDLQGNLVYQKVRFEKDLDNGETEKTFIYNHNGKASLQGQKQTLYGLEQFLFINTNEIWITEGEKCRDTVVASMPSHANLIVLSFCKPSDFQGLEELFRDKAITVFEDNDKTGKKNTKEIGEILKSYARTIKVVDFNEYSQGYDVADFLQDNEWNALINKVENAEVVYESPILQVYQGIPDIDLSSEDFILDPFIPSQSVVILDGLGESGKSLLAMQLALCLTAQRPFLSTEFITNRPRKVFYLTAEETDVAFTKRLIKLTKGLAIDSKELENFIWISTLSKRFQCSTYRLFQNTRKGIEKTEFFKYIETITANLKPALIVLDSLANFYGLDENSSEHASIFMESLKLLCKEYDCSFLILHHQTKEAMKVGGEKIFRGSSVFREQARCRITLSKATANIKRLYIEKLNVPTFKKREVFISLANCFDFYEEPILCFYEVDPPPEKKETDNGGNGNGYKKATL